MGARNRFRTPALGLAVAAAALGATAPAASATTMLGGGVAPPVNGGGIGPPVLPGASGPQVAGSTAVVIRGLAYAPSRAPGVVKQVIWAANKIRHKPYKWGGGHRTWKDSGYDCSGSVSYALHGGGLLSSPLDSRGFMRWGKAGAGRWITVYASNGHAYMVLAGIRFDTSGAGESGPRWRLERPWERRFKARHPAGL